MLSLTVSVQGESIVVGKGTFTYGGESLELTDDEEYGISSGTERLWVTGWLVRVKNSGEIRVLVDEARVGVPQFVFEDSEYQVIHRLYRAVVDPGNVAADVDVEVLHVVPPSTPVP